jgi:5-methylthioadenosine/S-adenosylhomocysteine deaminase
MKILGAKYVLPVASEPIVDGAVVVEDGTIKAVGARKVLASQFAEADLEDLGDAAILPGFVNCHSHLELTAMRGAGDRVEHDFYSWLITLTKLRGEILSRDDIETGALAGAVEGARAGVTCFGDIGRFGRAGLEAIKKIGLRGVVFQETEFSPDDSTAAVDLEKLKDKFLELRSSETELVKAGISPHAPYTVSRRLFEKIAQYAIDEKIKTSIHAAESREEDELMRLGTGFFTSVYEKFGVEWVSPLCSSIEFLKQTGILETSALLAHCVTVSDTDIETIASAGASVAHCPKSNAKFGHGYAPFERLLDAGISVGLGTDSMASNNMCDMLEETRTAAFAARNYPDRKRFVTASEVLWAATLGGAKALGLDDAIGTLEVGKQADIVVVSLTNIAQQPLSDIKAALVFSSDARDVRIRDGVCPMVDETQLFRKLNEIGDKINAAIN